MNIKNNYLSKLVVLVLSLSFVQNTIFCAEGKIAQNFSVRSPMQNFEVAATVVGLPVAVLANNAEKSNSRSSHVLKIVDDLLVIAGQSASVYNKTQASLVYKDYLHYKILEILFRGADIAKHARVLSKKGSPVVPQADDADDVEVTEMRKNLVASAAALRTLVAPVVQAAARGYVALNKEDSKKASKKRLMLESLAFLTNRLSDYIATPKASLESDAQLVAVMASVILLLVDYKREIATISMTADRSVMHGAQTVETFGTKKDEAGRTVRFSKRAKKQVIR